jgi:hypothetical protein
MEEETANAMQEIRTLGGMFQQILHNCKVCPSGRVPADPPQLQGLSTTVFLKYEASTSARKF